MPSRHAPGSALGPALLIALWMLQAAAAQAQPGTKIWRCGNQYSDQPCVQGREIAPAPALPEGARAQADAATQKAAREAEAMARERERREASSAGRGPAVMAHPSPWEERAQKEDAKTGSRPKRPQTSKPRAPKSEHFTARGEKKR